MTFSITKTVATLGLALAVGLSSNPIGVSAVHAKSATAKTYEIPVRGVKLRVQFDPANKSVAVLTYGQKKVSISDLLFFNQEVFPAVRKVTGCNIAAKLPDNQLLPSEGKTKVPLRC